jgi:PGF-pre-PGF domain-containing protein
MKKLKIFIFSILLLFSLSFFFAYALVLSPTLRVSTSYTGGFSVSSPSYRVDLSMGELAGYAESSSYKVCIGRSCIQTNYSELKADGIISSPSCLSSHANNTATLLIPIKNSGGKAKVIPELRFFDAQQKEIDVFDFDAQTAEVEGEEELQLPIFLLSDSYEGNVSVHALLTYYDDGAECPNSPLEVFEENLIKVDNIAPELFLSYPEVVHESKVKIKGMINGTGSIPELKVQGETLDLSFDGYGAEFSVDFSLSPGENQITFEAKDCAGNIENKIAKVKFEKVPAGGGGGGYYPPVVKRLLPAGLRNESESEIKIKVKNETGKIPAGELYIDFDGIVSRIIISVKRETETPEIYIKEIQPGIQLELPVYKYFRIISNLEDEDIAQVEIRFSVETSWAEGRKILLYRYKDGWDSLPTREVGEVENEKHFSAISPGLSDFAISGEIEKEEKEGWNSVWLLILIPVLFLPLLARKKKGREKVAISEEEREIFGASCPYCGDLIKVDSEIIICDVCQTPHHLGCWEENKGCTTYGCERSK